MNNEVISSKFDIRDFTINAASELPQSYVCTIKVPVKNQGSQSTCVAHASSSLVEYHYKKVTDKYEPFSTEFIYGYREKGYYIGEGMVIREALKTLQKVGVPFSADCPGNSNCEKAMKEVQSNLEQYLELAYPHRISTYFKCNSNDEIKTAIMKHGPVLVSMNTYKGAKIEKDIYVYDPSAESGRHCVMIYGWDERGWLIQNSWGLIFAGDGRFVIPFDYKFNEAWGITDEIDDSINVKKRTGLSNLIYKIYNYLVNLWLTISDRT